MKNQQGLVAICFLGIVAGATGVLAVACTDPIIRKRVQEKSQSVKHAIEEWSKQNLLLADRPQLLVGHRTDNTGEKQSGMIMKN